MSPVLPPHSTGAGSGHQAQPISAESQNWAGRDLREHLVPISSHGQGCHSLDWLLVGTRRMQGVSHKQEHITGVFWISQLAFAPMNSRSGSVFPCLLKQPLVQEAVPLSILSHSKTSSVGFAPSLQNKT